MFSEMFIEKLSEKISKNNRNFRTFFEMFSDKFSIKISVKISEKKSQNFQNYFFDRPQKIFFGKVGIFFEHIGRNKISPRSEWKYSQPLKSTPKQRSGRG